MSNDAAARWYPRTTLVAALIVLAALSRLLPPPPNFTPVEAIGLFGGACLADRRLAFVVPLVAMALADLVLGLHSGMPVIYGLIAFNVWLGLRLGPNPAAGRVAGFGLLAASVFFLVSNFAVWAMGAGHYYTPDLAGLIRPVAKSGTRAEVRPVKTYWGPAPPKSCRSGTMAEVRPVKTKLVCTPASLCVRNQGRSQAR